MSASLLDTIDSPTDLRALSTELLPDLAKELREFIIDIISAKKGHLGASLGVVELTIALHYFFDTPDDRLVWDVGHQAYSHKILTGRKSLFYTNRQLGGLSGFPNPTESKYDHFGVGHSSTSISAALGMALSAQLEGNNKRHHLAIIGDASIVSGMAFEALNHVGSTNANLWIILNDNSMGIDPSVGALTSYFTNLDSTKNMFTEAFHLHYQGIVDGHSFEELFTAINRLKPLIGPKLLHIKTTKGKGLRQAEQQQVTYHAPGTFDRYTGEIILESPEVRPPKYQDVFGKTLVSLAEKNSKIIGITPAMPTGSSLKEMMEIYPNRAFDVGIAEQHAVTLAAGIAASGYIPYCVIYSTFLQRAYDQVIHDVALQKLPVIFCIDRAGIVGHDGATHHGTFDMAILRSIPNMQIYAPRDEIGLRQILYTAQLGILENPLAIRYPRGRGTTVDWRVDFEPVIIGRGTWLCKGTDIAVISIGTMARLVSEAIQRSSFEKVISHIDIGFLKPIDEVLLHEVLRTHQHIITVEDGTVCGGLGSAIVEFACRHGYQLPIRVLGIPDEFIPHGSVAELHQLCGLSAKKILEEIEYIITKKENIFNKNSR